MRSILIHPVYLGTLIFVLCFFIGKLGYEGQTYDYNLTLLFPFFFFLGGVVSSSLFNINNALIDKSNNEDFFRLPKLFDQAIRGLYIFGVLFASVRLFFIIKFIMQGYDLRFIEYNVRMGGALASLLIQILPLLAFYVILTEKSRKKITILVIITTFCCFAIPIKTHIIASILIVYLSFIIKSREFKRIIITSLKVIISVVGILFLTIYLRSPENTLEFILDALWLTFRHYTSFNIANLALELNTKHHLTYGIHTFSQIIDTAHYLLYQERFIDRSLGNGGVNSVVDGRELLVVSVGTNMSTAVRAWVWDFGLNIALLICFLYGLLISLIAYLGIKTRFYSLYAVAYLCGVFFFWDFDLFETRFQIIYFIFIFLSVLAYLKNEVKLKTLN